MESVLMEYYLKHSICESGQKELIDIFNKCLLDISEGILKTKKENKINSDSKKFASKKAEEYAIENDLSLEDFSSDKVTKKDVDNRIKEKTKNKLSPNREVKKTGTKLNEIKCNGLTKKGEICNKIGTHKPESANKHYCFRHSEDWKSFECDSDSSESESESESEPEKTD